MTLRPLSLACTFAFCCLTSLSCLAQPAPPLEFEHAASSSAFPLVADGKAAAIYVAPQNPQTVEVVADTFAEDVERVTGVKPVILHSLKAPLPAHLIIVGVLGDAPELDRLASAHRLDTAAVQGKWEAAVITTLQRPPASILPGVRSALVIAGADRRGAAYALFTLSREMGVSPWYWWADVPVQHHTSVYIHDGQYIQPSPSVQYRGIFFNDEDWGLRPWAAKKMDPTVDHGKGNIGPHTYEKVFELLLRLHANSLWPAMHPGSLAFNAVPENAKLADKWAIVMGSSHSEILLRNNVGEWSEKAPPEGDGPWNYQTNAPAMDTYWDKRLQENGKYENFYTVGLRGLHDSGLEAKGSPEVKAKLVEDAIAEQRKLLAERVNPDLDKIPQVFWLYKESLDLYRVGMKIPDDVTLGWTDDNYGYIRELPNAEEQKRPGGSGLYYHVSYWGSPHDYLWLCSTPPALLQEELTKAYDHGVRKYWVLNVGDLKPAEIDIDYFMQLATDEPRMAAMSQHDFLTRWFAEQIGNQTPGAPSMRSMGGKDQSPGAPSLRSKGGNEQTPGAPFTRSVSGKENIPGAPSKLRLGGIAASSQSVGSQIADLMTRAYALDFIRKPEFMGFNGYNDGVKRTAFNPLAWPTAVPDAAPGSNSSTEYPNQNQARVAAWTDLSEQVQKLAATLPQQDQAAFFELVGYPVEASAAMNRKFLFTDETFLEAHNHNNAGISFFAEKARDAYATIQSLTAQYNSLEGGKWDGMMSDAPRNRHVFEMPRTATEDDASTPLPASWGTGDAACAASQPSASTSGFAEQHCTVSINAAHFARKDDGSIAHWRMLADLGISGSSVVYGNPGQLAGYNAPGSAPWLEYDFTTTTAGPATLALHLLPTFPVDSDHQLRYAVSLDNAAPIERNAASGSGKKAAGAGDGPSGADWPQNVLRNSAIDTIALGQLTPGHHTLRLLYRDPGVVFEHLVLTFPGAPPAYPAPPEIIESTR